MKNRTLYVCVLALSLMLGNVAAQTAPALTAQPQAAGVLLKGTVTDESGAFIPGASVILTGQGSSKKFSTAENGTYSITGLAPGKYTVRIESTGFSPAQKTGVSLQPQRTLTLDASLKIAVNKTELTVQGETSALSTDAASNAGAIVLRGEDLQALSDDPDDLAADLQALAGPSAGPNGGQIFIDGFTNGQLPPKASIREIRINSNPFSSEYDRIGFGRIEVFTKPGSDRFRGSANFGFSDGVFNSRNPYVTNKPPFQSRNYGGNLSGPISKKSSFFLDFDRREIDDNAIIRATILDANLNPLEVSESVVTPQRRMHFSPRIDYQLTPKNTIVGRYTYMRNSSENDGIGEFSLPSRAYNSASQNHSIQVTETAVLSARAINETRLQFVRSSRDVFGNNSVPTVNVLESFIGGGSQVGRAFNSGDSLEVHNLTSWNIAKHSFKVGGRVRYSSVDDSSPNNFGGSYTFGGGIAPVLNASNQPIIGADGNPVLGQITSLERYRRTLYLQSLAYTPALIRLAGGGATQFSIAGGNPEAGVSQTDIGLFMQDDWRAKQNLTLNFGLRYETQSNLRASGNIAPRFGFAWSPDAKAGKQKTVIRGGFGIFYTRVDDGLTLNTVRFNGTNQQQYIVQNPDFYPAVPPISELNALALPQTIRTKDSDLKASYLLQTAIAVERSLPKNTTVSVTFTNSRAERLLRTVNVSAGNPALQTTVNGNVYQYESNGILRQSQIITNVSNRLNRNLTIFSFYVFNKAKSDTDGVGSFPSNPLNFASDYGRAYIDTRHRFVLGGSITTKYAFRLSPFVIASSGGPFNITTGRDSNGDSIFNDRPAFGDPSTAGTIVTQFGAFNPTPITGGEIIPRNYGNAPGSFTVNLRLGRTFGFGTRNSAAAGAGDMGGLGGPGGPGGGGMRGPGGGGPPGGGMRGGGGGGMRGGGGMMEGGSSDHRYNVSLSVSARNILNHVNPGAPVGNLSSPLFGQSTYLASGFGPGGSSANNRRLEFQLRFSF